MQEKRTRSSLRRVISWGCWLVPLAFVANVAVCWGIAAFAVADPQTAIKRQSFTRSQEEDANAYCSHFSLTWLGRRDVVSWASIDRETSISVSSFGFPGVVTTLPEALIPSWSKVKSDAAVIRMIRELPTPSSLTIRQSAFGWPFPALLADIHLTYGRGQLVDKYVTGIQLDAPQPNLQDARILPVRPLLGGFLGNTLLYAVVAAGLIAVPVRLRHAHRRRSGRCASCGYPITLSGICSECGASTTQEN